jgi:hypothetical protein
VIHATAMATASVTAKDRMSNALAIAAVTEALVQTLQGALTGINLGSSPHVTNTRPDQETALPTVGVNVFLYQIAPNPYSRNADLPTRNAAGAALQRPQAAIDLYYLLTFYGDDAKLEQQRLLGAVVRALHANPTLPRSMIQSVEQNTDFLVGADLDQQGELVRFTPVNFSLDELSKLWSFLLKTDYVLSTAYVASVVLIQTDDPVPSPALPVLASTVSALPHNQPIVATIQSSLGPDALIISGSQIVLTGRNFILDPTAGSAQVLIGGDMLNPSAISDTEITVSLPTSLPAGAQSVQLIQSMLLGVPPVPHRLGFQSNLAVFVLHPVIASSGSPPAYQIMVGAGAGSPPVQVATVGVIPTVQPGQRAILELLAPSGSSAAWLVDGGVITAATNSLVFPLQNIPSGTYLVRIWVDGADSPLDVDPSGVPVAPHISL